MIEHIKINHILDVPELQESVLLILLAAGQIETSINEGNSSIDTLVDSFQSMSKQLKSIIEINGGNELKEFKTQIDKSIVAFQFYDRLSQRLEHVVTSLSLLAELVSNEQKLNDSHMWDELKSKIRHTYSMQSEHDLFKLIFNDQLDIKDALKAVTKSSESTQNINCDIELF